MENNHTTFRMALKGLSWLLWIPHIISLAALYHFLPLWVGIVCAVFCVCFEKYLGFFIDLFAFIVTLVCMYGLDKSAPVIFPILQGIGLLLPLFVIIAYYVMLFRSAE